MLDFNDYTSSEEEDEDDGHAADRYPLQQPPSPPRTSAGLPSLPPPSTSPLRDEYHHRQLMATLDNARVALASIIEEMQRDLHPASSILPPGNCASGQSETPRLYEHVTRRLDDVTGDIVVRICDTDVIRITKEDILLDTGGRGIFSDVMLECINEVLGRYQFKVKAIDGLWFVSDGRFHLYRFFDGVVIKGAAKKKPSERV